MKNARDSAQLLTELVKPICRIVHSIAEQRGSGSPLLSSYQHLLLEEIRDFVPAHVDTSAYVSSSMNMGGYPKSPLILTATLRLLWETQRKSSSDEPILSLRYPANRVGFVEESWALEQFETEMEEHRDSLKTVLHIATARVSDDIAEKEVTTTLLRVFQHLSDLSIYLALGLRVTRGTTVAPIPSSQILCDAFERLNNAAVGRSSLTVGARAWAKHAERSSEQWWGVVKFSWAPVDTGLFAFPYEYCPAACGNVDLQGSEAEKNERARLVLSRIVSDAVWVNLHGLPFLFATLVYLSLLFPLLLLIFTVVDIVLPIMNDVSNLRECLQHETKVLELRVKEGYGARWSKADEEWEFRGFLEPQFEGGHDKRWRH